MNGLFLRILNMSISAGWLVLAVVLLRQLLKKAPKWIICILWGVVALRLMIPVTVQSTWSLLPSAEVFPENITVTDTPAIHSGIAAIDGAVNPLFTQPVTSRAPNMEALLRSGTVLWILGMAVLVLYGIFSYFRLRHTVRVSMRLKDNVYLCDQVDSPFLLGIIRPKIYLASDLAPEQMDCVIAHENAHIRRKDHWWKPLGFLLLMLHWFNPLMWLAYGMLSRDIEQACDEKVVAAMDPGEKVCYMEALVACSTHRKKIMVCPVAFGAVSVKTRVLSVLNYRKPAFWIVAVATAACVITAVCFLTNPIPCKHDYVGVITTPATCTATGVETLTCQKCEHSYTVPVPVLAHDYQPGAVLDAPSCIALGCQELICADCGHRSSQPVEKTAHLTGAPYYTVEANCSETGTLSGTCSHCKQVFMLEILETNDVHNLTETRLAEPTCVKLGQGEITCTRCDYHESCTYEKLEHDYVYTLKPSTCMSLGFESWICQVCGHSRYTQLPQAGHSWVTSGNGWKTCSICGLSSRGGSSSWQTGGNGGTSTTPSLPIIQWDPYPSITWP